MRRLSGEDNSFLAWESAVQPQHTIKAVVLDPAQGHEPITFEAVRAALPGLVEGHAHLSFCGAQRNTDLGDIPPEEHTIATLHNAKTLLDAGFTSAYSAASAKLRLALTRIATA